MIEVIPFQITDMKYILARQPEHLQYLKDIITDVALEFHSKSPYAFSLRRKVDGMPVACAGLTMYWPTRAEAWTLFAPNLTRELFYIQRAVKRFLDICPVKRIEAAIDMEREESHRWIKSLGFALESPRLKCFRADGGDVSMYVRIRED